MANRLRRSSTVCLGNAGTHAAGTRIESSMPMWTLKVRPGRRFQTVAATSGRLCLRRVEPVAEAETDRPHEGRATFAQRREQTGILGSDWLAFTDARFHPQQPLSPRAVVFVAVRHSLGSPRSGNYRSPLQTVDRQHGPDDVLEDGIRPSVQASQGTDRLRCRHVDPKANVRNPVVRTRRALTSNRHHSCPSPPARRPCISFTVDRKNRYPQGFADRRAFAFHASVDGSVLSSGSKWRRARSASVDD